MLCLLERLRLFLELGDDIRSLKLLAEGCSKQLKAWIQSLQDSDLKGERHVNQRTKRGDQAAREREEFIKELSRIRQRSVADGN